MASSMRWLIQMGITMEPIKWTVDSRYIMPILIIVQLWLSAGDQVFSR